MIWLLLLALYPLPNATVTFNPGGIAFTDAQGQYSKILDSPWTGSITAAYAGCAITPILISAANVTADSQVVDFVCQDLQPPDVQIMNPQNNGTVPRNTVLTVAALDNIGVVRVDWALDGAGIGSSVSAPFSLSYQFGRLTAWHMLTAAALDRAGNKATHSVRFRVK